jgi:hypothetical protein
MCATNLYVCWEHMSVNVMSAFAVFKLVGVNVSISEYAISATLMYFHSPSRYIRAHVIELAAQTL